VADGVSVENAADRTARSSSVGWLARAGLFTRGVVYAVIGILALELALGDGGRATTQQGALRTIADRPFGKTLLVLVAIGLGAYALWRFVRGIVGHGAEQRDGAADRVGAIAGGIAYALLCAAAIGILIGAGSGSGSGSPRKATGGVLGWSGGTVIVAIAGAVLVGVAIYQAYRGVAGSFLDDSRTDKMSAPVERAFTVLGVVGHVARAVAFALIGYGLIKAAVDYDPHAAIGLDGALRKLAHASYGPVLLGIVAAGFIGFGAYSIVDARYARV
jgi:hypothetical protein